MSNAVYPTLPGIAFGTMRSPVWSTKIQTAVSGKELRAAFWSAPIWKYTLVYEFLRTAIAYGELQTLLGFYNQRQGQFDSFLFSVPDDNSVTAESFGTGNGATTAFQLVRAFGGFSESILNLAGSPSIFVNGVLKTLTTDYTIGPTGVVTFTSAPASSAALTWTGSFYWRVRFALDQLDASQFMAALWELKKVDLISVRS